MATTMEASHEAGKPNATATPVDYRFFDPKAPEQLEEILGVSTEAILRLGSAATALGVLPPKVEHKLYALPQAVRLVPLIEEMQAGTKLKPEDVRPYRKSIKSLSGEVDFADMLAAGAGVIGLGVPLRRAINRRIEREFPARAAKAMNKARETIAGLESIESNVDYLAGFDNPQAQFVNEMNDLAQTVSTAIYEHRDMRVQGRVQEVKPEPPKGIMGFFIKAVRRIRSFFGFIKRRPKANQEVTAYDAGAGIEQALKSLTFNRQATEQRLPMLSKFVLNRLPANLPVTSERLAFAAPEILNFLFSTSPKDSQGKNLMDSIRHNPHEFRFITKFKRNYGRYSLDGIQAASVALLPAIRDVLPTEGAKVREIFDRAQALLYGKPANGEVDDTQDATSARTIRQSIRNRLKHLVRRRKPREQ
ncbi:MAG TPA: hypothetical protein VII55_02450 [Candidatus Saccharimonadales bacterium]